MVGQTNSSTPGDDRYFVYRKGIQELFDIAESHDIGQFFLSLMPPLRELNIPSGGMLYQVPDMEIEEAFETHRYLTEAAGDKQLNAKIRTRLSLFVSFHLLEADRWHSILGNVLNAIIDRNYVGNLLEGDSLGEKTNTIRGLLKECRKKGVMILIRDLYAEICNDDIRRIRNAFFHSHYTLTPDGDLLITKHLAENQQKVKGYFKFDEVQEIHNRTVTFLTAFATVRKERLRKLQARAVTLNHKVNWVETMYRPLAKQQKTGHRLTGEFTYRQNDKRWHFQGQLTRIEKEQ